MKYKRRKCRHGTRKTRCKKCHGSEICSHDRQRYQCLECGGFEVLAKRMLDGARRRNKVEKLPLNIDRQDILNLIGDGICPVFNIRYSLNLRVPGDTSATLDRFLPTRGYTKGNCFVISSLANKIKSSATTKQVKQVANWMSKQKIPQVCPQTTSLAGNGATIPGPVDIRKEEHD